MFPEWLTWNALLASLSQLEGHFLPHNGKTTISVPFFIFSRPEEKAINPGRWNAQMRAMCVLTEKITCSPSGGKWHPGWLPRCICMRGPSGPAEQVRLSISLSYSEPGSFLRHLFSETYSTGDYKVILSWRQEIQTRDFLMQSLIRMVHISIYSSCHYRSRFFGHWRRWSEFSFLLSLLVMQVVYNCWQVFAPLAKRSHGIQGLEQCLAHSQASR